MKKILGCLFGLFLTANVYGWYEGPVDADTLDGNDSSVFLTTSTAADVYVTTGTYQVISASKTFSDEITITANLNVSGGTYILYENSNGYIEDNTGMQIKYANPYTQFLGQYGAEFGNRNASYDTKLTSLGNIQLEIDDIKEFSIDESSATFYDIVSVGSNPTINYVDGAGDLIVTDELEVDGNMFLAGGFNSANTRNYTGGATNESDNLNHRFGSDYDFSMAYYNGTDEFRIARGSLVATDANVAFRITVSTVVAIGDGGTMNQASNAGDLFVEDVLEVDGIARFDSLASHYNQIFSADGQEHMFGTGYDFAIGYESVPDEIRLVTSNNTAADANVVWRGVSAGYMAIGDAGTINYADGSGDLYVEDELEVDGEAVVTDYLRVHNDSQTDGFVVKHPNLSQGIGIGYTTIQATGTSTNNQIKIVSKGSGNITLTPGNDADVVVSTGCVRLYAQSEAQLKVYTPNAVGQIVYDSTNKAVLISTGTGAGDFGLITDGSQSPTGW